MEGDTAIAEVRLWRWFTEWQGWQPYKSIYTLKRVDGEWQVVDAPEPISAGDPLEQESVIERVWTAGRLLDIEAVSPEEAWAVGSVPVFGELQVAATATVHAEHGVPIEVDNRYYAVVLRYSGGSWARVSAPELVDYEELSHLNMVSADDGWALAKPHAGQSVILHFTGGKWEESYKPDARETPNTLIRTLADLQMVAADEGWAVMSDGTLLRYSGGRWDKAPVPAPAPLVGGGVTALHMLSESDGWLAAGSRLMRLQSGTWVEASHPEAVTGIGAVQMLDASNGWAVGVGGAGDAILSYNGSEWSIESEFGGRTLTGLYMLSPDEGWAAGYVSDGDAAYSGSEQGVLFRYTGGQWQETGAPANLSRPLLAVDMYSAAEGWAVGDGGTIMRYEDGAWSLVAR
jgi:hypothetical protein